MAERETVLRLVPPIAPPPGSVRGILAAVLRPGSDGLAAFAGHLARLTGKTRAALFGSGRAALACYLQDLGERDRDEVVVPAYTCWSVPASIVRAGLRVRLVDLDPHTWSPRAEALERALGPRTRAVIATHLLGRSVDVTGIVARAREVGSEARVIEDAAQAWPVDPSAADAVLLSFGRGKPLPLGSGGAIALGGDDVALTSRTNGGGLRTAASLAATALLTHPRWYRVPQSIPWLGIGVTAYDPSFDTEASFHAWQGRLGIALADTAHELRDARTANARALTARIEKAVVEAGWSFPAAAGAPGLLRLPLLAPSRTVRDRVLERLMRRGVAASAMYPAPLDRIDALRPHLANAGEEFPGARTLADRLITLPVYPGLAPRDLDAIARELVSSLERTAR